MIYFLKQFKKTITSIALSTLATFNCEGNHVEEKVFPFEMVNYEDFMQEKPIAIGLLKKSLYEKGIVGIRGIPSCKEKVLNFIDAAKKFTSLSEETRDNYAPNSLLGEFSLGYEKGKEKFMNSEGVWVIDDLKDSYYAFVPDNASNKWPFEIDLKTSFQELGELMSVMGEIVMEKIELIGSKTGISLKGIPRVGRMLHYRKSTERKSENPFWCGGHYDHGLFTVLTPAVYFKNGEKAAEPKEAGLFVKTDGIFMKILANELDVLFFQVGEFGQLVTNDHIRATEHRVHKTFDSIERYTMALFFDPPMETTIYSSSILTEDDRYKEPCSYLHWHQESLKRYLVK